MMEEPLSRGASPSGNSTLSGGLDIVPSFSSPHVLLEDRLQEVSSPASSTSAAVRNSLNLLRTPPTKKAKRVRFFRNGDKFYTGVVMAVTAERYRSFDSLATDLTRALISNVTLPNGVRSIYSMDGRKITNVGDLEDGKCYVCSGQGESFKKVEYSASKVRRGSSLTGLPQSPSGATVRPTTSVPLCVQAKIVTIIRHGTKPRRVLRLLLNKRNAPSFEHALEAITDSVKLDSGAVRKVYTLNGVQVNNLEQFFSNEDDIFLAYGSEKSSQEDFELDFEESKAVQSFRKGPCLSKRHGGPMPPMPKKSGKKNLTIPQVRTPSPVFIQLPLPLRMHFLAGHVIGDGNFAVVRHCIQRRTGLEYALKVIDKYKCQGQGTMLDSEIAIMRQVCHPNIISLIAEQETTDQLFLVMELVKGGDLFDAIAAATKFSEPEASVMISHLISALAYLHAHHIVHRDVKPENLLVEMEGSRVSCLKLGDFGLAQVVREPLYTVCGTPTYVAPEILAETGYGLKIDVWAAGVIMYILLCGFPPFVSPENEQEELFERILSGHYEYTAPYWDSVSESAKQLISNMLQIQPELRFSAEDVLDHPWLSSFLGGDTTCFAATATDTKSSEQYRNKQRKPIRQATYDFNYDCGNRGSRSWNNNYPRRRYTKDNKNNGSNNASSTSPAAAAAPLSFSDTRINEIDLPDGYYKKDEDNYDDDYDNDDNEFIKYFHNNSISVVDDIKSVTKSMHDLMRDIDDIDKDFNVHDYDNDKLKVFRRNSFGNKNKLSNFIDKYYDKVDDADSRKDFLSSENSSFNNDIENSDSFFNLKYVDNNQSGNSNFRIVSSNSSSSSSSSDDDRSIESTDSFENLKIDDLKSLSRIGGGENIKNDSEKFEKNNFSVEIKDESLIKTNDKKKVEIKKVSSISKDKKFKTIRDEDKSLKKVNDNLKICEPFKKKRILNEIKKPILSSTHSSSSSSAAAAAAVVKRRDKKIQSSLSYGISNSTDELRSKIKNEDKNFLSSSSVNKKRFSYQTPKNSSSASGGVASGVKLINKKSLSVDKSCLTVDDDKKKILSNKKYLSNDELIEKNSEICKRKKKIDTISFDKANKRSSLYYTPQPSRKNYFFHNEASVKNDDCDSNNIIKFNKNFHKKLSNNKNFDIVKNDKTDEKKIEDDDDDDVKNFKLSNNDNFDDDNEKINKTSSSNPITNPNKDSKFKKDRKSVCLTTTAASRNRSNKKSIHLRQDNR